MPFERRTLTELNTSTVENITSRMEGTNSALRRSNIRAISSGTSGLTNGLHGHLDFNSKQFHPKTCDEENLAIIAAQRKIPRKGSQKAQGVVDFIGLENAVINAGTILNRGDGVEFEVLADTFFTETTASAIVEAVEIGAAANSPEGEVFTFASPLEDVESTAAVAAGGITNGADLETIDGWRTRVDARWHSPIQGGNKMDYWHWAMEVTTVTRVWPSPKEMGPGTMTVRYVRDGETNIFPDDAHCQIVKDYIDSLRSVIGELYVVSPIFKPLDLEIALNPLTEATKKAVIAELLDLIHRKGKPGGTILISWLREAVSLAVGENDNAILNLTDDVFYDQGEMPAVGVITWSLKG